MDLLGAIEVDAQAGPPTLGRAASVITPTQQKILKSSVYLQLYNLVEATVSRCLETLVFAFQSAGCQPRELTTAVRSEWVRAIARTHTPLSPENRLEAAIVMCDRLLSSSTIDYFEIQVGGGNWDDKQIEKLFERVGVALTIEPSVNTKAKRHVKNDMGAFTLVKDRRNKLAHGSISFVECTDSESVSDLRSIVESVSEYLRQTINSLDQYIGGEIARIVAARSNT